MEEAAEDTTVKYCIVCHESVKNDGRALREKGLQSMKETSLQCEDNLDSLTQTINFVHNKCYKNYTRKENIKRDPRRQLTQKKLEVKE